ncbi:MAG: helix-turn-helix domain-containing protein [Actinomycetota bacterium]|nr:helix-turn-helix domain-containing protein [Actinomycetota bacterium]
MRSGQPLPLRPAGSVSAGPAAALVEGDDGGMTLIWGMAASCWSTGDVVGRRLAAVNLVETGAARHVEVARAFGINDDTLREWRRAWQGGGVEGLAPGPKGPKGPSKLTPEMAEQIRVARGEGKSLRAVAAQVGVSTDTVRRGLADGPARGPAGGAGDCGGDTADAALEVLARPEPRGAERALAHAGLLFGATPVICQGASLSFAGALLILPALAVAGLLEVAGAVFALRKAAFYSVRSLFLALVFCALVGEARAEGLTRLDPVALGRLIGLDRAPEVGTVRRRMDALAGLGRSGELLMGLARSHAGAHPEAMGVLYVDGHVRAYHGGADLPRAHLARARIAMAATTDTWLADANGNAVLVWSSPPGAALTGELRTAAVAVRALLGPDARPIIAFDRGGWSPKVFAELVDAGFDICTYRKGPLRPEPLSAFESYQVTDAWDHETDYLLADRAVRLYYDKRRRYFACRQVTRLDPASGHQTQVIITRTDLAAPRVAATMFSRWREENLFRFMRPRGLDAMDSYAKIADDPTRMVPNPAKAKMAKQLKAGRGALADAKQTTIDNALAGAPAPNGAIDNAEAALTDLKAVAASVPAKVPLGTIRPHAVRLDDERKRLHDAIRMATWNAESTLAAALSPHYARAEDEAHSLLAEAFSASADLEIIGNQLHVRLDPLSAPRRSRAIAALAEELTTTETLYPGTDLRLVYSVKTH